MKRGGRGGGDVTIENSWTLTLRERAKEGGCCLRENTALFVVSAAYFWFLCLFCLVVFLGCMVVSCSFFFFILHLFTPPFLDLTCFFFFLTYQSP